MTAKQFKIARKKLGMTQKEMAALLGYSREQVAYWEGGKYEVPKVVELCLGLLIEKL